MSFSGTLDALETWSLATMGSDPIPNNMPYGLGLSDNLAAMAGLGIARGGKAIPAAEKTAVDMAKRIQRDLGPEAREMFHDLKVGGDRTLRQLKEHAAEVYEAFGGTPPKWMRP